MDWLRSQWSHGVDLALCGLLVSLFFAIGLYQRFVGWVEWGADRGRPWLVLAAACLSAAYLAAGAMDLVPVPAFLGYALVGLVFAGAIVGCALVIVGGLRTRGSGLFGLLLLATPGVCLAEHRNVCGLRNVAQVKAVALVDHHKPFVAQVVDHGYGHAQLAVVDQHAYAYPYYYQVGQGLRIEAIAEKTAEKLTAGLEALIEKKVAERLASLPAAGSVSKDYARAQAIANASCVSCHAAETDPDRLDLTDLSQLDTAQMTAVFQQVYSGRMPKNAQPLSEAEVGAFTHILGSK